MLGWELSVGSSASGNKFGFLPAQVCWWLKLIVFEMIENLSLNVDEESQRLGR